MLFRSDQQAQQQQDFQNQLAQNAQQQIAQAQVNKQIDQITGPDAGPNKSELSGRDHESKMMDKKIELERIKKTGAKKTVAKEARELGLTYIGENRYANNHGQVTHMNENGILKEIAK